MFKVAPASTGADAFPSLKNIQMCNIAQYDLVHCIYNKVSDFSDYFPGLTGLALLVQNYLGYDYNNHDLDFAVGIEIDSGFGTHRVN